MLFKLLKYDFLYSRNQFLALGGLLLTISLISRFLTGYESFVIVLGMGLIVGLTIFMVLIMSIVFIYQNFAKNLFSEHGYLMFTLPVNSELLLVSKILISLFWYNFMSFVGMLMLIILSNEGFQYFLEGLRELVANLDIFFVSGLYSNLAAFLVISIFFLIISLAKFGIVKIKGINIFTASILGIIYFVIYVQILIWFYRNIADFGQVGFGIAPQQSWAGYIYYMIYVDYVFIGTTLIFGCGACTLIAKLFKKIELIT